MPCQKGAMDPSEKNKISAVLAKKIAFLGIDRSAVSWYDDIVVRYN